MFITLSVWSVIGLILKWILYVVLGVIGLVLLILLIVLLNPLRYGILASRRNASDAEKAEKSDSLLLGAFMEAHVKVSWLLHLVRVKADFADKKLSYSVKVAWKTLAASEEEKAESTQPDEPLEGGEPEVYEVSELLSKEEAALQEEASSQDEAASCEDALPPPDAAAGTQTDSGGEEALAEASDVDGGTLTESSDEDLLFAAESLDESFDEAQSDAAYWSEAAPDEAESAPEEAESLSLDEKIDRALERLDQTIDRLDDLPDQIDTLVEDKLRPVNRFLNKLDAFEDKDKALKVILLLLKRELRPLVPKKAIASVSYGTGDPYLTSRIQGYLAALAPFLFPRKRSNRSFEAYPDLDERTLEFEVDIRDWFLLGAFIPPLIAAICNIHTWHLIKFLKNLKK